MSQPSAPVTTSKSKRGTGWFFSKFGSRSRSSSVSGSSTGISRSGSISNSALARSTDQKVSNSNLSENQYASAKGTGDNEGMHVLERVNSISIASLNHNHNTASGSLDSAKLSPETVEAHLEASMKGIGKSISHANAPGFLASQLRKLKNTTMQPSTPSPKVKSLDTPNSRSRSSTLSSAIEQSTISRIESLKKVNTHRVSFAKELFEMTSTGDPPQQIPARNPKKGRTEKELTANPRYLQAVKGATLMAHNVAVSVANQVKNEKLKKNSRKISKKEAAEEEAQEELEEKELAEMDKNNIKIDSGWTGEMTDKAEDTEQNEAEAEKELTLEKMYTKCCHLREILPIQATLEQLEGHENTLPYLKLMNSRPTLVEVQSFADFISIAPVDTLILNNLDVTEIMFKHLILALTNSKNLCKLSLKNANLTTENWLLLNAFLISNKTLAKLDISVAEPRNGKKRRYKQAEWLERSELDWELLTNAIIERGGIEELIINGCLIPHEQFGTLIRTACTISTKRLGVASSDLMESDLFALEEWIQRVNSEGIDLGGNELENVKSLYDPKHHFLKMLFSQKSLLYVSLNSCHLKNTVLLNEVLTPSSPTTSAPFATNIRFMDISFNPDVFPDILDALCLRLSRSTRLKRIHLDSNNLKSRDIIALAEAFSRSSSLSHVSIRGNRDINTAAVEALAVAIKMSKTLTFIDIDPDLVPPEIQRRISHYALENMENIVDDENVANLSSAFVSHTDLSTIPSSTDKKKEDFDPATDLLDDGKAIVDAVNYVVSKDTDISSAETSSNIHHKIEPIAPDNLIKRANIVHESVKHRLEEILTKYGHYNSINNDQDRDHLMKLYYLDATLESVLLKYNSLKQKLHSRTMGMYYPPSEPVTNTSGPDTEQIIQPSEYEPEEEPDDQSHREALKKQMKLDLEEGQFHKLGVFMNHSNPTTPLEDDNAGNPIDKLTGQEFRNVVSTITNSTILNDTTNLDTTSSTKSNNETTVDSTPSSAEVKEKEIQNVIERLKKMDDLQLRNYFFDVYGKMMKGKDINDSSSVKSDSTSEESFQVSTGS